MKEKKRVLLSGREPFYIEPILESTDWIIELLIVDYFTDIEKYRGCKRIKKIMTLSELLESNLYSEIDFETLQQYMYAFQTADYGSRRIKDDFNFSHYDFLVSVAFWKDYFEKNHIDICIISNHYHAYKCDYIVQEIAKKEGIPCFNIFYHNEGVITLYNANQDKLEKINVDINSNIKEKIEEAASYVDKLDLSANFLETHKFLARMLYSIGGMSLYRMCSLVKNRSYDIAYKHVTFKSYRDGISKYRSALKANRKLYKAIENDEKFVIYFLHLEPEAVIPSMTNTVVSQLFIIDMLSKALPEGWCLYVKEHPDSYKLNQAMFDEIQTSADTYITPYFYEKIAGMQRVKLIDYKVPAGELIAKCKAMATITGTVTFEGIKRKKPIILFANNRSIYKLCRDFMFPQSLSDLRRMMNNIEEGFIPDYSDYEDIAYEYLVGLELDKRIALIKRISEIVVGENDD